MIIIPTADFNSQSSLAAKSPPNIRREKPMRCASPAPHHRTYQRRLSDFIPGMPSATRAFSSHLSANVRRIAHRRIEALTVSLRHALHTEELILMREVPNVGASTVLSHHRLPTAGERMNGGSSNLRIQLMMFPASWKSQCGVHSKWMYQYLV